jgi:hypothetical protein
MDNPIHEETQNDHVIKIFHDPDPESPREWDNLGTITCWHRRYRLGDKHDFEDPQECLRSLAGYADATDVDMNALFKRATRQAVILPLYLYDHSGITMNTTGFHCPWDSGQVGYTYATLDDIRKEYSVQRVSAQLRARVAKLLVQEVAHFDDFITGNCYGYVVSKDEEQIDACWGYFGDYEGHCLAEARACVS